MVSGEKRAYSSRTYFSMVLLSQTSRSACFTMPASESFQYLRTGALHLARIHSWPSGLTRRVPPILRILRAKRPTKGPILQAST